MVAQETGRGPSCNPHCASASQLQTQPGAGQEGAEWQGQEGQDSALSGTTTHTLPWSRPALQCPGLGQSQTQRGSGGGPPSWPQEGGMGHSPTVTTVSQTEARPCRGGSRPNSCVAWSTTPSPLWALLVPRPFSQPKLPRDPSSEGLEVAQAPVLVLRPMWPSQDAAVLQTVLAFSQTKQFPVVIPEPVWGFCRRESFGGQFFQFLKHHLVVLLLTRWGSRGIVVPDEKVAPAPHGIQEAPRPPSQKASD